MSSPVPVAKTADEADKEAELAVKQAKADEEARHKLHLKLLDDQLGEIMSRRSQRGFRARFEALMAPLKQPRIPVTFLSYFPGEFTWEMLVAGGCETIHGVVHTAPAAEGVQGARTMTLNSGSGAIARGVPVYEAGTAEAYVLRSELHAAAVRVSTGVPEPGMLADVPRGVFDVALAKALAEVTA